MSSYAVARLPLLSPDGDLINVTPSDWKIQSALRYGVLRLSNGPISHTIEIKDVLASEISEEREINDLKKTFKRMALTGIGSSLFWEGRRGGIGAGLLDLSARGVEKKGVYGGSLIFRDTSIINFVLFQDEFEALMRLIPEEAFEEEAIDEARELLNLLERMSADGPQALEEFANELIELDDQLSEALQNIKAGKTFAERDNARTNAEEIQGRLLNMRHFFRALLVENRINYRDFAKNFNLEFEASKLISIAGPSLHEEAPLPIAQVAREQTINDMNPNYSANKELLRTAVRGIFVVVLVLIVLFVLFGRK